MVNKLILGCGIINEPSEFIDYLDKEDRNIPNQIIHNLNFYPYPIKDNSYFEIICHNTLEHLCLYTKKEELWTKFFNEIGRILKPNGIIDIIVPHFASCSYIMAHHQLFGCGDFKITFNDSNRWDNYLIDYTFKIKEIKIIFPRFNKLFGLFINLSSFTQEIYEKYLCGIIRSQDMKIVLKVLK